MPVLNKLVGSYGVCVIYKIAIYDVEFNFITSYVRSYFFAYCTL